MVFRRTGPIDSNPRVVALTIHAPPSPRWMWSGFILSPLFGYQKRFVSCHSSKV